MGIRVNLTDQEAKSTDREPLPKGKFHLKITDMQIQFVANPESANNGKPYLNFEFTVQDGQYAGRKDWTNAMAFDGALYTISQILKALGRDLKPNEKFEIPDEPEFYIGKDLWGRRDYQKDKQKRIVKDDAGEPRIQLQGFSKYEGGVSQAADVKAKVPASVAGGPGGGGSVLP
jgi:hypothetical protein